MTKRGAKTKTKAQGRGKRRAAPPPPAKTGRIVKILSMLMVLPIAGASLYGLQAGGHLARIGGVATAHMQRWSANLGFGVKDVVIQGRDATPESDILNAVAAVRGSSIFSFDCEAARARLLQNDHIADAEVHRLLPGTIEVELSERKPLAIWQHEGKLTLVDASGHAIAPVDTAQLDKFPHVVGIGAETHAAALLDLLAHFPQVESHVRAAIRVGDRRWNLQLDNGIEVWLPADNVETALTELIKLDKEQKVLARDIEAIDMRFKDRWILKVPTGSSEIRPGPSRST